MRKKVSILEFAPTADEIWRISRHSKDGYVCYSAEEGLISILDTAHDAKPRPDIIAVYAGGKATNVARVLDRLLTGKDGPFVELVTFLPPPPDGPLRELEFPCLIKPSTPAGIYVQCLQISELKNVKPHFEIIDELRETEKMQTTRRCIEITLKEDNASMNFSPRIVWSQESANAVMARIVKRVQGIDMLVMAGAPPVWDVHPGAHLTPHNFYAKIIDAVDPDCLVSIDVRGYYLNECLKAEKPPRFIFMNMDEFQEVTWEKFGGKKIPCDLIVHDKDGCWVWSGKLPDHQNAFSSAKHFPSLKVPKVYSTIGAGDAMHAGFLKEWFLSEDKEHRLYRSVLYSQVVSAISVSNEKATHGIDVRIVEDKFQEILTKQT